MIIKMPFQCSFCDFLVTFPYLWNRARGCPQSLINNPRPQSLINNPRSLGKLMAINNRTRVINLLCGEALYSIHTRFLRETTVRTRERHKMFSPLILYFIEYYIKNKLNNVNEITNGNTCLLLIKPFYTL